MPNLIYCIFVVAVAANSWAGPSAQKLTDLKLTDLIPATITVDSNWKYEHTVTFENSAAVAESIMKRMQSEATEHIAIPSTAARTPVGLIYSNCRIDSDRLAARTFLTRMIGQVSVTCEATLDLSVICSPELKGSLIDTASSQGFKIPSRTLAIEHFEALGGQLTMLEEGGWLVRPPSCPPVSTAESQSL